APSFTPAIAPTLEQPTKPLTLSEVQEIPPEEAMRNVSEASDKRPTEAPSGQWKKTIISSWHKSRRKGERSKSRVAKGKGPTALVEGASTFRMKP
ncbi:hypothetical protein B296_00041847, partial [Ensete ventricosum]